MAEKAQLLPASFSVVTVWKQRRFHGYARFQISMPSLRQAPQNRRSVDSVADPLSGLRAAYHGAWSWGRVRHNRVGAWGERQRTGRPFQFPPRAANPGLLAAKAAA